MEEPEEGVAWHPRVYQLCFGDIKTHLQKGGDELKA